MTLINTLNLHTIESDHMKIRFLPSGDLYDMMYDHIQINLQKGNDIDGSLSNLYVRFSDKSYIKLFSSHLDTIQSFDKGMIFDGHYKDMDYRIIMSVHSNGFTYKVSFRSKTPQKISLYFGQDIGIQDINGILNNEAYIVQYIDFKVFENLNGYTLCARQNQGMPAYFQMGMDIKTIGYSTDAMQFFKTQQKRDGHIYAMDDDVLANEIYQYEQSYLTLQSELFTINSTDKDINIYGYFEPNHSDSITKPKDTKMFSHTIKDLKPFHFSKSELSTATILSGDDLTHELLETLYPQRLHEEFVDETLYSFFLEDHAYVTTHHKESILERSTGHILMQGDILNATENVLTTTSFMNGIFLTHVALGNTSFHKLLGDHRHALMLHKMAGLRLYIKYNDQFQLLGMPTLYEIGLQHNTWIYAFQSDIIKVHVYGNINSQDIQLSIESLKHIPYDMFYTMQLLMGPQEWLYDLDLVMHKDGFEVLTPEKSMAKEHYPTLSYGLKAFDTIKQKQSSIGVLEGHFTLSDKTHFILSASFNILTYTHIDLNSTKKHAKSFYSSVLNHIALSHDSYDTKADMHMLYWYTHNALIHYASPHGLEQYNGAAWGTRDVCQGPFEFFSAIQKDDILKHILKTVYGRQFLETGDFPQWFMYDKYKHIQAHESHGDVIFWPLKALGYYLNQTGDLSILDEVVPQYSLTSHQFINPTPLYDHVKLQIKHILLNTIDHLPIYGGGDWDDTLQPANNTLKERMVSGWTTVLMIQTLESFALEIKTYDNEYAKSILAEVRLIKASRLKHLLPDGIPAGFVVFEDEKKYLLHPRDLETSLKYRLLPITRSMIAGLNSIEENTRFLHIIDTYLKHPDGVRLMDHAVLYQGGKKTHFNRAETAANFGREIGLQYVHAHIRYMEAMYQIKDVERAYEALMMIHPIHLHETLKHALPRQRNAYFSSSDGAFKDRYQAKKHFDLLREGKIDVKGGWRIYSSGPGILIHQMITNTYGIKRHHMISSIQPNLPKNLNGLKVTIKKEHI